MSDDDVSLDDFDLTAGMEFDIDVEDIEEMSNQLRQAEAFDVEEASSERLAEFSSALKELADHVEDARKDVFEAQLDKRVEVDENVGPLVKRHGSRRYVENRERAIRALEANDIDPVAAMKFNAKDLEEILREHGLDPREHVSTTEYEYFRRRR
jgi:hypothetical protein